MKYVYVPIRSAWELAENTKLLNLGPSGAAAAKSRPWGFGEASLGAGAPELLAGRRIRVQRSCGPRLRQRYVPPTLGSPSSLR